MTAATPASESVPGRLKRSWVMFLMGAVVVLVVGSMLLIILVYAAGPSGYGMMGYPGGRSWIWVVPMASMMVVVPLAILLVLAPFLWRPPESGDGPGPGTPGRDSRDGPNSPTLGKAGGGAAQ